MQSWYSCYKVCHFSFLLSLDDIILVRLAQRSETREGEDVPEQDEIAGTQGADEPSGTDFSYELDHGSFTDQGRQ